MIMYVIADDDGHFTTSHGYQRDINGNWSYICYTGRCDGMRYYTTQELAQNLLSQINIVKEKLSHKINFKIIQIDKSKLPFGERIYVNVI